MSISKSFAEIRAHHLDDPIKWGCVENAFNSTLAGPLERVSQKVAAQFLQFVDYYFSCLGAAPAVWNLNAALSFENLDSSIRPIQENVEHFFDQVRMNMNQQRADWKRSSVEEKVSVVVLTTLSCGGMGFKIANRPMGHYSPALACVSSLTSQGISAAMLDVVDGEPCVYDRFPVVEPTGRYAKLRAKVAALNPEVIINTICHDHEDLALRFDLDVPVIAMQTDYAIYPPIAEVGQMKKGGAARFFEMARFSSGIKQLILADSDGVGEKLKQAIGSVYDRIVKTYIFPTRQSFERLSSATEVAARREQLGIRETEQVVVFTSGFIEGQDMRQLIPLLNTTEERFNNPLYVAIVCGSNDEAYCELNAYFAENPSNPQMRFKLERKISGEQMAAYGQVAALGNKLHGCMIGKAGGSTVSENLVLGLYTLMLPEGGCEEEAANRTHMEKVRLGETLRSPGSLIAQLKGILDRTHEEPSRIANWEAEFIKHIAEAMH